MALKAYFGYNQDTNIGYFATGTMSRGGIVSQTGNGSGVIGEAMDNYGRTAGYTNSPSGCKPLGLLLQDVVDIDVSRQQLNPYKNETLIGSKVTVLYRGEVMTNMIGPGQASGIFMPTDAYLGPSGLVYSSNYTASGWSKVGQFITNIDADGYATLRVDIR